MKDLILIIVCVSIAAILSITLFAVMKWSSNNDQIRMQYHDCIMEHNEGLPLVDAYEVYSDICK